jgi:hypothetical protein
MTRASAAAAVIQRSSAPCDAAGMEVRP